MQIQELETVEASQSETKVHKPRHSRRAIAALLVGVVLALGLFARGMVGGDVASKETPNPPATQLIPFVTIGPHAEGAVGSVDG